MARNGEETKKKKTKIHLAIDQLRITLKKDESYFYGWQANIAMSFQDCLVRKGIKGDFFNSVSNQAAKDFLNLLIATKDK